MAQGQRIGARLLQQSFNAGHDWPKWFTDILTQPSGGVISVIGKRHSGKTTLCVKLAEVIQDEHHSPILFPGYPEEMAPNYITPIPLKNIGTVLDKAPPNSVVIIDDASALFSSKRTMTATGLGFETLINTCAHRQFHLLINTQDSSDLHKAGMRADCMVFKPPEMMFAGSERPVIRKLVDRANNEFSRFSPAEVKSHAWVWKDSKHCAMIEYEAPEWMGNEQAKYKGLQARKAQKKVERISSYRLSSYTDGDEGL
jgi:hypothetical protein